jgi:hypothetical protein
MDATHVRIHLSVNAIEDNAFYERILLVTLILNDGPEEIR